MEERTVGHQVRCDPVEKLSHREIATLQALLSRHLSGVKPTTFFADLANKTHVVRLFDEQGELLGFSTFAYVYLHWGEVQIAVVYSGDTIVDPSGWSAARLAPAWITSVWAVHGNSPLRLVWLLICSGIRTYRFLPVFWRTFVPAPRIEDEELLALRDYAAAVRFGSRYSAQDGIVRLVEPHVLKDHLLVTPAHLERDEYVRFFLEKNPGHHLGDELACVCELKRDNLTSVGQRVARQVSP